MKSNTEILSVLNALSVIANGAKDGARNLNGDKIEIGLRREEGCPIRDSRVMDGFSVQISGDKLKLTYNTDVMMKDLHDKKFEEEILSYVDKVASFLKKEFKSLTGKELSLSECCEPIVYVQPISRIRTSVKATKTFEVKNLKDTSIDNERPAPDLKDWLTASRKNAAKARNVDNFENLGNEFDPFKMKARTEKTKKE